MTIKTRAAVRLAKHVAAFLGSMLLIYILLSSVPVIVVPMIVAVAIVAFVVYQFFKIYVAIEETKDFEDKMDKMDKNRKKLVDTKSFNSI